MIYKFKLGENSSIAILTDNYVIRADNSPIGYVSQGIALRIWTDEEKLETTEIVMNKDQAKAIIKALKIQLKTLRRQKT